MKRVMGFMEKVVIADKHVGGDVMASWGVWKAGTSAVNNFYKKAMDLVALRRLEKGNGYFRLPGCKSEYAEHARILTRTLASILKVYPDSLIYREHTIPEVGLRPDALCLLTKEGKGRAIWLEVCNTEEASYFEMKKNALKTWDARPYLSKLFGYVIPSYDLVRDTDLNVEEL